LKNDRATTKAYRRSLSAPVLLTFLITSRGPMSAIFVRLKFRMPPGATCSPCRSKGVLRLADIQVRVLGLLVGLEGRLDGAEGLLGEDALGLRAGSTQGPVREMADPLTPVVADEDDKCLTLFTDAEAEASCGGIPKRDGPFLDEGR